MNRNTQRLRIDRMLAQDLFQRRQAQLLHSTSLTCHCDQAEDLTAEIFLTLLNRLPDLNLLEPLDGYLLTIFRNRLRSPRPPRPLSLQHAGIELPVYRQNPLRQLLRSQLRRDLDRSIAALPFRVRTVIKLYHCEGDNHHTIHAKTGLPLRTVQRRLREGRTILKKRLAVWESG